MSHKKIQESMENQKTFGVGLWGAACLGIALLWGGQVQAHRSPSKSSPSSPSSKSAKSMEKLSPLFFEGASEDADRRGGSLCAGERHVAWVPRKTQGGSFAKEVRWIGLDEAKRGIVRRRFRLTQRPYAVRCVAGGLALRMGKRWQRVSLPKVHQRSSFRVESLDAPFVGHRSLRLLQRVESGMMLQDLRFLRTAEHGWRLSIQRRNIRVARGAGEIQHLTRILLVRKTPKRSQHVLLYEGVLVESLEQGGAAW